MKVKLAFLAILFFGVFGMAQSSQAATYYMRADGVAADKAGATSCSTASSAMSIATHNTQTFSADDTIYLCSDGGPFTATIIPPSSGTAGHQITYKNAPGESPIINPATIATGWGSPDGNGVYSKTVASAWGIYAMFEDGLPLYRAVEDLASVAGTKVLTSTTGQFTAGMVGKSIKLFDTGHHFVNGSYLIDSYNSPTSVTLDTDPTDGNNAISGGDASLLTGNYIDYDQTLYYKPTSGAPTSHTVAYDNGAFSTYGTGGDGIFIKDKQYITIDGIEFRNAHDGINMAETTIPFSGMIVQNNRFIYSALGVTGGTATNAVNGVIRNNYFYRLSLGTTVGTTISNPHAMNTGWIISGNELEDIGTIDGTRRWGASDDEAISGQNYTNTSIIDNYIHGGYNKAIFYYTKPGNTISDNVIARNRITNNGSIGIYIGGEDNTVAWNNLKIFDNLLINCGGPAFNDTPAFLLAGGTASTQPNLFANNTVYGGYIGLKVLTFSNFVFKNNIIDNNADYNVQFRFAMPTGVVIDNNLYSSITGGLNNTRFSINLIPKTLNQWQALNYDGSGLATDPLFVSATDFHLQSPSPAINAGVDVGLTSDFAGNPIVGAPDIGAYEYQGAVASTPSSDTTSPAAPTGLSVI